MYCTNCGKEISNEADVCIHCGKKVNKNLTIKTANEITKQVEKRKNANKILLIVIPSICFLFLVLLVIFIVYENNRSVSSIPTVPNANEREKFLADMGKYVKDIEDLIEKYGIENFDELEDEKSINQNIYCKEKRINKNGSLYLKDCKNLTYHDANYQYGEYIENNTLLVEARKYADDEEFYYYYFVNEKDENGYTEYYEISCRTACEGLTIWTDYAVIKEGTKSYIYNYKTKKIIVDNLDIDSARTGVYKNKLYGFVLVKNKKEGFYNLAKKEITIPISYDYINAGGEDMDWGELVSSKTVLAQKNKKYGLINIEDNSILVPLEHEWLDCLDKYCISTTYYAGGNDKYLLLDTKNNKLLNGKQYDRIVMPELDKYVFVVENKEVKLLNLKGELIKSIATGINAYDYYRPMSGTSYDKKDNAMFIMFGMDECTEYIYYIDTDKVISKKAHCGGYAKPVLYLYPTKITEVKVKFEKPDMLTTTYPKFNKSWEIIAYPNGDLFDKKGNYYYALYWEEQKNHDVKFDEGFYVTKDNAIEFLEEKLAIIGLNNKERNEFIMYWLPILERNEKNLVYFELTEERDSYNKLNIYPEPDSILRMAIHIKKIDNKADIKEQKLIPFERKGFAIVEWGGVVH